MRSVDSNSRQRRHRRYFIPYFVLALGLVITAFFTAYIWRTAEARDLARFNSTTQELTTYVRGRPRLYVEVQRAGSSLFALSPKISQNQFQNFIERLELRDQFPGAQGVGYISRLSPEMRDEYDVVTYFDALDRTSQIPPGYNMYAEKQRRAAMDQARDTGLQSATGRVMVPYENAPDKAPGFLIFVPIYKDDRIPATVDERRQALTGFVYSQFQGADFLKSVLAIKNITDVDIRFYDGTVISNETLVHDTAAVSPLPPEFRPRFTSSIPVDIAGRPWTITFASRPSFGGPIRSVIYYSIAVGIVISFLLFALTQAQVSARASAEQSAAEVRVSERKVRESLSDREKAEQAVRESEERYRELVENANDIVYTLDLQGNVVSINKAAELITGYAREDLLHQNLGKFLTPESVAANRSMLQRKLAGEERTNYEMDLKAADGRLLTFEINSRLIFKEGAPAGVQGIARDITTRRRAEEALRMIDQRALAEYERLLERVSGLAQTLGTARDLPAIYRGLREFTFASVPCDGFFVSLYDPARDVRTACYGWADGQEIDTSELPPMPVTSTGPNSRAVRTNQVIITDDYMKGMIGHPAVLVGPDNGLRPQSSLSAPMSVMGRVIGTIEVQSYEPSAYREGHVTAMRMAANLTAVAIENVRLLDRESTARANAEESNRLKDEFLATVSHELRTPLTAILGWSRMLEGGSLDDDVANRAIETIKRNAKAQAQIIDDILDVSRIITGNLYLELHPIELGSIVEAAINVVRPTADAKGIHIEVDLNPEPAVVSGDSNRLQQVFWNLLSNAVKFTPTGGKVRIYLRQVDSQIELQVTDSGQGITAGFLPFVFDRFRQADSTSTRQHGGLGLGLAIARHLIEIHGGTIQASSAGEDQGATFTVQLPMVGTLVKPQPVPEENVERPKSQEVLSGINILIVDDDEDTLELLTAALEQRSASVTAVSSAAQALDSIKTVRPDVLISDIAMPGEDGYELIRKVIALEVAPMIPSIAITAYAKDEDRERALAAGYHHFLSKPVELREFISTVAQAAKIQNGAP